MATQPYSNEQIKRAQRLRLQRCLTAGLFYLFSAAIMGIAVMFGLYPATAWFGLLATYTLANAVFIPAIASGYNLRFADPSLTAAQIAAALLNCTITLTFAGELRGIIMLAYVLPLQFGAFALTTQTLLRLCLIPAAGMPLAIACAHALGIRGVALELELVQWFALMMVLPFTAYVGGRLFDYGRYKKLSDHDELSGLHNRRAALAYLDQLTRLAHPNRLPFCVALLDFDHFKRVNDTWGHASGDAVIRSFALLARDTLRNGDMIARWGGEEFLIILHSDLQHARASVERLRAACAANPVAGIPEPVTVSAGLAEHAADQSIPALIEAADRALYAAKHNGRNRIELAASATERRSHGAA